MKSSPSIWHLLHNVKLTVKISSIFVVFLEHMNFNIMQKLVNSATSTNNPMLSFGLSAENVELSPI